MVAAVIVGLLAVGIYLLLRLTPLTAVDSVTIVGVEGPKARETRRILENAATGQSTLGFDAGALKEAVANMPSITGIDVHTRFPHGVQIEVHQRVAVAALAVGGRRVAVATDGTLLPEWNAGRLPIVNGGRATGGRLIAEQRAAVRVLGAAPERLLRKVARVDHLTTVRLANGPALIFRDTDRVNAKWAAAVAVLADASSVGSTWIDLRVPERPVAGRGAPPTMAAPGAVAPDLRGGTPAAQTDSTTNSADSAPTAPTDQSTGATGVAADTTQAAPQTQP